MAKDNDNNNDYYSPHVCVLSCFVMFQGTAEPRELWRNNALLALLEPTRYTEHSILV
jgi:hypothetical protein